jgi:hypothetical protein
MPIKPCKCASGKSGRKWGDSGKCYCGKGAAAKAGKQASAAYAHGYSGEEEEEGVGSSVGSAIGGAIGSLVDEDDDGALAASPRMDRKTVTRLLELCRENRRRRGG